MKNIEKFMCELNTTQVVNLTKERIGNQSDGGYVTLKELNEKTTMIYTAGVGDDVSFELDFKTKYPSTWFKLFDPTINGMKLDTGLKDFIFSRSELNIGEIEGYNNLLKMDIEYDEWQTLMDLNENIYESFSQMIIEFHLVDVARSQGRSPYFTRMYDKAYNRMNEVLFDYYLYVLRGINSLFYIHHIHPNNSLPKVTVDGFTFPPLIEVSFVRKDLVSTCNGFPRFPVNGLDYPNKLDRPDITNFYPIGDINAK